MHSLRFSSPTVASLLILLAASALVGCSDSHGEPWINPGQEQRLGDQPERTEYTEQQLRDRLSTGQAQR
ncbi:MAG: hypothetical protein ACXIUM_00500 [Wenzhouxiangella sp.]